MIFQTQHSYKSYKKMIWFSNDDDVDKNNLTK